MGDPVNFKSSKLSQLADRKNQTAANSSAARTLASSWAPTTAMIRLWQENRGEAEPEDLSGDLIVQLGMATETLNRSWYERNTGRTVTDVQRWVQHPVHRCLAATLNGFANDLDAVFEAKYMLPWSFPEETAAKGIWPNYSTTCG